MCVPHQVEYERSSVLGWKDKMIEKSTTTTDSNEEEFLHHYVQLDELELLQKKMNGVVVAVEKKKYDVWAWDSFAIPMTYICVGLLATFPSAYVEYFPRTKGATDAQLSTLLVVRNLPWTFKVLFGVLPDRFPIRNYRFKPYMFLGYGIASFFHYLIAATDDLTVVSFTLLLLGAMFGMVMADVMGDALVASRVLKGQEAYRGQIQSIVYMCRYLSEMSGYWIGAFMSNPDTWSFGVTLPQMFLFLAVLPFVTSIPTIYLMEEPCVTSSDIAPLKQQIEVLWHMLQLRATWQPLFFLAFFNAFALHNSAWGNYLKTAYHFDAFQYGSMSAIGASVTFLGIYVYRYCIMNTYDHSWHQVYYFAGFIMCLFSILNILLVFNVNEAMGIPAFWFSIGDTAIISFAKGIQVLPLAIIFVAVCPQNQEGVAFALLTSITNLAHAFAYTISNILLVLWPVELPDLENHHYDGVWKLTLFTSVIGMIPLLFVKKLLPKTRNDLEELKLERSVLGARAVFGLYIFGFVWVTVLSILAVVKPCSVFVGGQGC